MGVILLPRSNFTPFQEQALGICSRPHLQATRPPLFPKRLAPAAHHAARRASHASGRGLQRQGADSRKLCHGNGDVHVLVRDVHVLVRDMPEHASSKESLGNLTGFTATAGKRKTVE